MSKKMLTPKRSPLITERAGVAESDTSLKRKRVLSCMLCQQRKIKCDRQSPCVNCVRASVQCVPATLVPRQKRRRFAERELLDRIRSYEDLLRRNNVHFQPLHKPFFEKVYRSEADEHSDSDDVHLEGPSTGKHLVSNIDSAQTDTIYEPKSIWTAMNQKESNRGVKGRASRIDVEEEDEQEASTCTHGDVKQAVVKDAWDLMFQCNDHLLFLSAPRDGDADLSTFHPGQAQMFKLWQIYLDNVDPLLKITHSPTLQARFIDAAGDITKINSSLEALMFSIYCAALQSLNDEETHNLFGCSRRSLLDRYYLGCQYALRHCGILRSGDRESLTALTLYMISVRPDTHPRSLATALGVAMRLAQRLGIHVESINARCPGLEAEMRRRLWWALVIFDNRIRELSDQKTTMLMPTWSCNVPRNINDLDARLDVSILPAQRKEPTEALFVVVRSELADIMRYSECHLDFTNPSLKHMPKEQHVNSVSVDTGLVAWEKAVEDRYFEHCNAENPLHFMTIWTIRGALAKHRLHEHYALYFRTPRKQTNEQRNAAFQYALSAVECDTKLTSSPLCRGYRWHIHSYFPFPAFIHVLQDLKQRPTEDHAERAWDCVSDNVEAHSNGTEREGKPALQLMYMIVMNAWHARVAAFDRRDPPLVTPRIVSFLKSKMSQIEGSSAQPDEAGNASSEDFSTTLPTPSSLPFDTSNVEDPMTFGSQSYMDLIGSSSTWPFDPTIDWSLMDWNPLHIW